MVSRRSLARNALALVCGGFLSTGVGTAARSRSIPTAGRYDASAVADAATTAVAAVDSAVVESVGVPDPIDSVLTDVRARARSVSVDDIESIHGSVAIDGNAVAGGCAAAVGSFDTQAVESELRNHELEFTRPSARRSDGVAQFVAADGPYAVALEPSTLRVGYGRTRERAVSHLDAALADGSRGQTRAHTPTASYGSLPSLLDGDAVAYADLGSKTRSQLVDSAADRSESLAAVVETASAIGCSLQVGSTRSRIRYGLVTGPSRLSRASIDALVDEATTGDHALTEPTIHRSGRTVVVDAAVETPSLWAVHEQFAVDSPQPSTSID
ncbi:hypothetical protein [Natronorubrum bangense]|uniref:Uncharacterized protein n=2 Tax=Natronorubrum bangense TaxID=61858 RepID=L9WGS1_9EURY|nr:hypothetical protein [Natronorubrum bangense]ELY48715.1 hypothetical protein C494_10420 [Natronorubrum bangense JCM 10635]QCC53894.1 hypothetical protein DV706_04940 [Natronorubrum bangense]